jgi:hypothetical protein
MHDVFILLLAGVGLDLSALLDCFIFICKSFGHPIYSRYNAKKFLELTTSNFVIVIFFFHLFV